ncbi:MAG: hypothetical protein K8R36_02765 [Planctomycetales bacterium]|nr:hypothetical protein [Planctomycetales bacterium]
MNRTLPLCVALLLFFAGCGGGRSTSDYVPDGNLAKQALTLSLDAWKNSGQADPAGKLPSGQTVKAVDMFWSQGQKLSNYEIVRELPATGTDPRQIVVKLTDSTGTSVEATYFVVGIDPIQVYRDKDYSRYFGDGK